MSLSGVSELDVRGVDLFPLTSEGCKSSAEEIQLLQIL